jgi:lysozyme
MPVVNDAALDLICGFEGFVDHWYPDPAHGWKVPTCCFGHTDAAGEPKYANTKTKTFTKAEGRLILERDLAQYAAAVRAAVKVPLNDNQFGALVSFTYNLGAKNLNKSTLLKKLNAGDYDAAAKEFGRWTRAGGKVLPGLVRRRAAEADLFRSGASVPEPQSSLTSLIWQAVVALAKFILDYLKGLRRG